MAFTTIPILRLALAEKSALPDHVRRKAAKELELAVLAVQRALGRVRKLRGILRYWWKLEGLPAQNAPKPRGGWKNALERPLRMPPGKYDHQFAKAALPALCEARRVVYECDLFMRRQLRQYDRLCKKHSRLKSSKTTLKVKPFTKKIRLQMQLFKQQLARDSFPMPVKNQQPIPQPPQQPPQQPQQPPQQTKQEGKLTHEED